MKKKKYILNVIPDKKVCPNQMWSNISFHNEKENAVHGGQSEHLWCLISSYVEQDFGPKYVFRFI